MSIAVMSRVWSDSQHAGSTLLMLLAIADFADDDGQAYPAVQKLADKCRMSKRNAQDRLRELADSGELSIFKNQGPPPKFPNLFQINLTALGMKPTSPVHSTAPVKSSVSRGEVQRIKGVKPTSSKPSGTIKEPSKAASPADRRFADFWSAYPSKVGKDAARKAFDKRKPDDELLTQMLAALGLQKRSDKWLKDGGQYIPNPATWLNQGRWMDEVGGGAEDYPVEGGSFINPGAL